MSLNGSNIGLAGCGMRHKVEAEYGIRDRSISIGGGGGWAGAAGKVVAQKCMTRPLMWA